MAGVNKAIIIGNLGKDPELRKLESGAVTVSFPIATTEHFKDKSGEKKENTEWHNIVAWGTIADNMNNMLKKGSCVYIEGKIRTRSWEKDNVKRYSTEIVVDSFQLLKGGKEREHE